MLSLETLRTILLVLISKQVEIALTLSAFLCTDRKPPGVGRGRGRGREDGPGGRPAKGIGRGLEDGGSKGPGGGRGKGGPGGKGSGNRGKIFLVQRWVKKVQEGKKKQNKMTMKLYVRPCV